MLEVWHHFKRQHHRDIGEIVVFGDGVKYQRRSCTDKAGFFDAVSPRAPRYLFDLVWCELSIHDPVKFLRFGKKDRFYRQIHPHRDRIGSYKDVALPFTKSARLFTPHFGREVAIDRTYSKVGGELLFEFQHLFSTKRYKSAPFFYLLKRCVVL